MKLWVVSSGNYISVRPCNKMSIFKQKNMKWYHYKVDYLYNEDLEDFQFINSTSPLDKHGVKDWLNGQIGSFVEKFKIKEIWEIEPAEEFNDTMFKFTKKIYPED